ncbi:MAG: TlpA family protein disulfide reductase, partial [Muribaculaceae bacterium]|nr:TlpA family protein disulfide reductase [Muribaculaceae bacterium]
VFTLIKSSVAALLICGSTTAMAKEKTHITVRAAEGVAPTELAISKSKEDSAKSAYKTKLENGIYEIDIETDFIEQYHITDLSQLINNGSTSRFADFLIEDGAEITVTLHDDRIDVVSTGQEQLASDRMKELEMETFMSQAEEIEKIEDETIASEMYELLNNEINKWEQDYYIKNPMISFMLDLDYRLASFRFNDHTLMDQIKIYNEHYSDKYPGHPAHQSISKNANSGLQIYGGNYHDYDVRTIDGEKVRASDFLKPGCYNLVILWATWCAPCRRECQEIAAFIDPYIKKGLNVFALTREFENTDALKSAVEKDKYPWPTLVDLDNEFRVFNRHGASSSGVFIIDPEGKIVFADFGPDEVKAALDSYLN